jgi:hypothetical protein
MLSMLVIATSQTPCMLYSVRAHTGSIEAVMQPTRTENAHHDSFIIRDKRCKILKTLKDCNSFLYPCFPGFFIFLLC